MSAAIILTHFSEINLEDPFFDSLKKDYEGFKEWFERKATDAKSKAFISYDDENQLTDFLYLKKEDEEMNDVLPSLPRVNRLKVGTFKIEARNSKRGEFFIKKIMDTAVLHKYKEVYATIFPKHKQLIHLFEKHGFECKARKLHPNGEEELVLIKDMNQIHGDLEKDFPKIKTKGNSKYLLSIYPEYHTRMFPESILKTELSSSQELIRDVSPTNSLHKIYVCSMKGVEQLKAGDIVVIYRTSGNERAEYKSVCTGLCVIEENLRPQDFSSQEEMIKYIQKYNLFEEKDILYYAKKNNCRILKMLYSASFKKKIIRKELIEKIGLKREDYYGFLKLTDEQFSNICKKGEVDENYFIH